MLTDGTWVQAEDLEVPALSTVWSRWEKNQLTLPVVGKDGHASSPITYAYLHRKPIWLTKDGGECLGESTTSYVDSWSLAEDLPEYKPSAEISARTSILIPLEYGSRVFGVLELEFEECLPLTENAKLQLRLMAASAARVFWLHETSQVRSSSTLRAFKELEKTPARGRSPIEVRTVFLSTPEHSDDAVTTIIRAVLEEFAGLFEVKFWKTESLTGDIKQQVREALLGCEFGVCYLSEEAPEGTEPRFRDNPNVIFEAGMLQAMHEARKDGTTTSRWIPVREAEPFSTPLPFNFATDRVVQVPRDPKTGKLLGKEFKDLFREAVRTQVESVGLK